MRTISHSGTVIVNRSGRDDRSRGRFQAIAVAGITRDRVLACLAVVLLIVAWSVTLRMDDEGLEAWGATSAVAQSVAAPRP